MPLASAPRPESDRRFGPPELLARRQVETPQDLVAPNTGLLIDPPVLDILRDPALFETLMTGNSPEAWDRFQKKVSLPQWNDFYDNVEGVGILFYGEIAFRGETYFAFPYWVASKVGGSCVFAEGVALTRKCGDGLKYAEELESTAFALPLTGLDMNFGVLTYYPFVKAAMEILNENRGEISAAFQSIEATVNSGLEDICT